MAIIGDRPERFAGHAELYLRALAQFGHEGVRNPAHAEAAEGTGLTD